MSGVELVEVRAEDADQRLDRWLRRRVPGLTQGRIEKLLRKGEIRLDGKRADGKTRVYAGQVVRLPPNIEKLAVDTSGLAPVSEQDARFVRGLVIHQDADVIVLDKPPGLAVQGGTGQGGRHLDAMLGALAGPDGERPRLVHRLDLDTSGVLVLGHNVRATALLAEAFRGRSARKTYWALVAGVPKVARGRIDMALAKSGGPGGERVAQDDEEGKRAVTLYATVDHALDRCAWLAMRPVTGRTHQLRVHAAVALGTPIVGDTKYGGQRALLATDAISPQLHLHARSIDLPHPAGGRLRVAAPLPPHMRATWKFFGFEPGAGTDALLDRRDG
ncbi:MAG: RluA family pseudouridine synthase [Alphaproteobacteria bacterium]|nr:RluA family pseudouridine synthase [Alphaproteobacteria bacterium]